MLNGKLIFFFTPYCFASTSVWKRGVARSCWWQVLCCPQSLPHQAVACHCHPSCKRPPLRAPGEDIPEVELLAHRALWLPAGLACANLFCRASARVHTGHLGGVWSPPSQGSSQLWLSNVRQTDLVCDGVSRLFFPSHLWSPALRAFFHVSEDPVCPGKGFKFCTMLHPSLPVHSLLNFLWRAFLC